MNKVIVSAHHRRLWNLSFTVFGGKSFWRTSSNKVFEVYAVSTKVLTRSLFLKTVGLGHILTEIRKCLNLLKRGGGGVMVMVIYLNPKSWNFLFNNYLNRTFWWKKTQLFKNILQTRQNKQHDRNPPLKKMIFTHIHLMANPCVAKSSISCSTRSIFCPPGLTPSRGCRNPLQGQHPYMHEKMYIPRKRTAKKTIIRYPHFGSENWKKLCKFCVQKGTSYFLLFLLRCFYFLFPPSSSVWVCLCLPHP